MNIGWVLFVAKRYFRSKRREKTFAPSVLSVAGIAVGVMTLVSVMAVMNGFQLGFIEDILEISSYHLRIVPEEGTLSDQTVASIAETKGVQSLVPFYDMQTLIRGRYEDFEACFIRGVAKDADRKDPSFIEQLGIEEGGFRLGEANSIVMGGELANSLGVSLGDTVTLVSLAGASFTALHPEQLEFVVTGLFRCGYYEFDKTLAFISLEDAAKFLHPQVDLTYGVKIDNRFRDREAKNRIEEKVGPSLRASIVSWREYNSSFFGALRTEKLIMMILVGLIFIVVGVNIYHSLKRAVYERLEEISVLRATGAPPFSIRSIFICDGLFIGFLGGIIGLALGLTISIQIDSVFTLVETIVNGVLFIAGKVLLPLFPSGGDSFAIFSPRYYYLTEIPSQVLLPETVMIFLFAVISSGGAAYAASKRISSIRPSEVLRYE
jgi:lipoprotein-releasing system permease protein